MIRERRRRRCENSWYYSPNRSTLKPFIIDQRAAECRAHGKHHKRHENESIKQEVKSNGKAVMILRYWWHDWNHSGIRKGEVCRDVDGCRSLRPATRRHYVNRVTTFSPDRQDDSRGSVWTWSCLLCIDHRHLFGMMCVEQLVDMRVHRHCVLHVAVVNSPRWISFLSIGEPLATVQWIDDQLNFWDVELTLPSTRRLHSEHLIRMMNVARPLTMNFDVGIALSSVVLDAPLRAS